MSLPFYYMSCWVSQTYSSVIRSAKHAQRQRNRGRTTGGCSYGNSFFAECNCHYSRRSVVRLRMGSYKRGIIQFLVRTADYEQVQGGRIQVLEIGKSHNVWPTLAQGVIVIFETVIVTYSFGNSFFYMQEYSWYFSCVKFSFEATDTKWSKSGRPQLKEDSLTETANPVKLMLSGPPVGSSFGFRQIIINVPDDARCWRPKNGFIFSNKHSAKA